VEQLTIFEVLDAFDENSANWENVLNNHERCTVIAYIPEEALSPIEIPFRMGSSEWEHHKKIWGDYCIAIWREIGFVDNAWEKACRKLKEYRDTKKPCPMQINRCFRFKERPYFKPSHVVEYL
jgi:hypothetical protein